MMEVVKKHRKLAELYRSGYMGLGVVARVVPASQPVDRKVDTATTKEQQ